MGRVSRFTSAQRQRLYDQPSVSGIHHTAVESPSLRHHVRNRLGLWRYGEI